MKNSNRSYFYFLAVTLLLIGGLSGLGTVWMRQQISRAAERNRQAEVMIAELERRTRLLDERIASATQPRQLRSQVASRLSPAREDQVVFVREERRSDGYVFAVRDPYDVAMDLALLDSGALVPRGGNLP